MRKAAILLHNLGGPADASEVRRFLANLFSDRDILPIPLSRWLQRPVALAIARLRATRSARSYAAIGGSPLLAWTQAQAKGVELGLREHLAPGTFRVLPAMRYWEPSIGAALDEARAFGAERIVSLPLYPQFSSTTTGSSVNEMRRRLDAMCWDPELVEVDSWHTEPGWLDCLAWRARRAIERAVKGDAAQCFHVYAAHGVPRRVAESGDPYVSQISETVAGVEERLSGAPAHAIAFQSRAGPVRWTRPHLDDFLRALPAKGARRVVVTPVSFVSDHVETLHELDIVMKEIALDAGIETYVRTAAPNADPDFLGCLTDIAWRALASRVAV